MAGYSTREQRQHQRWREEQRNGKAQRSSKQSKPAKRERGTVEMSSNNNHHLVLDTLQHVSISVKLDETQLKAEAKKREEKAQAALDRLFALPGMEHIRAQVEQMIALKKVAEKRKAAKLKTENQSLHMVFTGNPGTGKTTVARLIGEAFIHMGLLKSGHDTPPFIEVHLSDIESPYIGRAEENMNKKFQEARGGVLFMDEAYSFGGPYHHNKVFLGNLVSKIEDMRDEVLVIMAGYSKEMQEFLDENPGLRSRFPSIIDFPDYELENLIDIAEMMAKERDYSISTSTVARLMKRLEGERKLRSFGNARTVRNVMEEAIRRHSLRMMSIEEPTKEQLMILTGPDINTEVKAQPRQEKQSHGSGNVSGHIIMVTESKQDKAPYKPGEGDFH